MKPKFYSLDPTFATRFFWGQAKISIDNKYYKDNMRGFHGSVEIKIDYGGSTGDFLWNSHNLIIVTKKVLDVWREFVKFDTYEIVLLGKQCPTIYTGVIIHGRGGPLDTEKSQVQWGSDIRPDGSRGIIGLNGLYFFEDKWDKSDLFHLDNNSGLLATERVIKSMKKAKITNCKYVPIEEIRF